MQLLQTIHAEIRGMKCIAYKRRRGHQKENSLHFCAGCFVLCATSEFEYGAAEHSPLRG